MKRLYFFLFTLLLFQAGYSQSDPILKIGLVADPQYADKSSTESRSYRQSLEKLSNAVDTFNSENVDFVQTLGDIIDEGWSNYDSILPIYNNLNISIENYHLLGNHEFSVDSSCHTKLLSKLSMPGYYYSYEKENWLFIVLDATDYSYFSKNLHEYSFNDVDDYFEKAEDQPNHQRWNSAIGKKQQNWLKQQLDLADAKKQDVIIFCHMPVKPAKNSHNLWNDTEIVQLIEEYPNVFAYFNGHNHSGSYINSNGIHYITLKGMVNTNDNSFAILEIYDKYARLNGFGSQNSYKLSIEDE